MPDEYISRETAIKYAEHAYHEWNLAMAAADGKREINLVYKRQELCKAVESVFRDTPAADVAPVVHGQWYMLDDCANAGLYCSACGRRVHHEEFAYKKLKSKYCPHCGAKMDGAAE